MTDKQIIIDGVDVSGCKHYKNRSCIADYCLTDMPFSEAKCELNPNCHYKQLKLKEQECEELREEIKHYKQIAQYRGNLSVKYTNKSAKLKQTLTEIKFWARELLKRTGQVVPYEIKQILQEINECEVKNE